MISEHLMRPGTWSLGFTSSVPVSITSQIERAMEGAGGAGCHVVVTPTLVDVDSLGVTAVLASASYTGRVTKRPSRTSVEGVGILDWLNTYPTATIAGTTSTPTQWVDALVANGLTAGAINNTGASNVTRTFPAHLATRRELLDTVASAGSWEYRVQPDFTIDAAVASTLFTSFTDPTLVVTRKEEGPDGVHRGVDGGMLDQELNDSQLATAIKVLAEDLGAGPVVGTASAALTLKTWDGATPVLVDVVSSPATPDADKNTIAQATLNLRGARRKVSVSSSTYALHRFARPGDYVWLYDPTTGLYDVSNQIQFRGETIAPAKVRLLSWSWPIEAGLGVYLLLNGATPTLVDLSDWVEFESGDTFWTVGDWSPPSYGRVNRMNPEIELRLS